jgi:hypothetical protein
VDILLKVFNLLKRTAAGEDIFSFLCSGIFLSLFFINSAEKSKLKYFRMKFLWPYTVKFIYDA